MKVKLTIFKLYNRIHANSPGLSGSLPDTERISRSPVRIIKNAFQIIFSFFQNQNSARFYNFDLFKRNHSAKKHKFHEKNRKTAYMLRKWALFHASGEISKI